MSKSHREHHREGSAERAHLQNLALEQMAAQTLPLAYQQNEGLRPHNNSLNLNVHAPGIGWWELHRHELVTVKCFEPSWNAVERRTYNGLVQSQCDM